MGMLTSSGYCTYGVPDKPRLRTPRSHPLHISCWRNDSRCVAAILDAGGGDAYFIDRHNIFNCKAIELGCHDVFVERGYNNLMTTIKFSKLTNMSDCFKTLRTLQDCDINFNAVPTFLTMHH